MRKKLILGISLLLAAAGIVLATLFLPVTVGTGIEELRAVRLGRPFWIVVQDQSRYSPPGDVLTTRFLSPWECPFAVVWWRFLASSAAVAGLLWLVLRAVALLSCRRAGRQGVSGGASPARRAAWGGGKSSVTSGTQSEGGWTFMWFRRTGFGILVALGAVLMAFCVWFAWFRLVPAYEKMVQTGDEAAFGLGLLMVLWWFLPALAALVVGSVLLWREPGSVPAVLGRLLAVVAWVGAALAVMWALPQFSGFLWGACGWYVLRMIAAELMAHLLLLALGLLLAWAGVRLWRNV